MKSILLSILTAYFATTPAWASESCHELALKRIERIERRADVSKKVAVGFLGAAWVPAFGYVWYLFPGGPAIYGGLMAGAGASGLFTGYQMLRARHFTIRDLQFQLLSGAAEENSTRYMQRAIRRRDAFILRLRNADPSLTEQEIERRFSELDALGKICTGNGRYFSDRRIAEAILGG